jgi:hypothetical protein
MKCAVLIVLAVVLSACVPHIDQRELKPVKAGESIALAAPLRVIEDRGLSKIEWQLLPGTYVERFSLPAGRVFLSEQRLVQATTTLGEKVFHPGGWIVLKDKPGQATLYILRGKSGQEMGRSVLLDVAAGVEGDLTLIADFPLSTLKRR